VPDDLTLLRRIDSYLDAVPRSAVRTERVGPFTLFVQEGNGWRYYARPSPRTETFTPADVEAVRARQRELGQPEAIEWVVGVAPGVGPAADAAGITRERMRAGATVTAAAFVDGTPVSVGSHNPCEGATEIVGVATLPAYRRRGIGAALTSVLIRDAIERRIGVICLSAGSPDIARVYAQAGFRQVGEVGAAEPPA